MSTWTVPSTLTGHRTARGSPSRNGSVLGTPIWIADADGSAPEEVVPCGEGCQAVDSPAWSPDGTRLVYYRNHGALQTPSFTDRQTVEIRWTS